MPMHITHNAPPARGYQSGANGAQKPYGDKVIPPHDEVKVGLPHPPGLYGDERIWAAAAEAKAMFKDGVLLADVLDSLGAWNRGRCKPPLGERDLILCAESALRAVIAPTPRWSGFGGEIHHAA